MSRPEQALEQAPEQALAQAPAKSMARAGAWLASAAGDPRRRRCAYAALALILAVLCVLPRTYVARARVLPQDAQSLGLGSTMGAFGAQFQGFAAMFGGARQPIDLHLAIGRGAEVTEDVIRRLRLVGPDGYASREQARRALERKIDIHSLTGGLIEIEARTHDPREAEALTGAYVEAIGARLVAVGRERVERKRRIVLQRFGEASDRVVSAEAKLDGFRRRNRLALPEAELGSALSIRVGLESRLQARQVELETLRRFRGPESPELGAAEAEVASLREQIARAGEPGQGAAGPNLAGLSRISGEYLDLYREYRFAQALYEVYSRSSEEVAVETLAGETASDVQVIEAARLDADRKFNLPAVALLALLILTALFTEIYAPATGIVLPWSRREGEP
jgi:uncharacterized protein involved in exopolysaccharide biosynthesis